MVDEVHDIIVIGAGISGLSAAKVLADHGLDVLVLEAADRIGGRVLTVKNDQVGWADLGGGYIRPGQNHVLRLVKEFGLQMFAADESGQSLYYDSKRGTRIRFNGLPNLGFLTSLDVRHIFQLLDKYGEEIPVDAPWNTRKAEEWDQTSVQQFIHQNTIMPSAREYLRTFVATMVACEQYQCSLLWFAWFIKNCGGTKALFANGGPEWKLVGGAGQIADCLASAVGRDRVLLQHPVSFLEQTDDLTVVRTVNGKTYHGKYTILSIPPAVQQKIHYLPPLDPMHNQLIQRAHQGSVYKAILYYERAFWRSKNLNGCLVLLGPDHLQPMPFTFEDSKPDGSKPAILGFIPADKAIILTSLTKSKKERCQIIADSFAAAFECEEARDVVHYEEKNWAEDQYCGGGYLATPSMGFLTRFGPYLRQPIGRMYFAGTECAFHWSGYMNGAVQAGERAARQVLVAMGRLAADQIDQVEPVSQEYPPVGPFEASLLEQFAPSAKGFLSGLLLIGSLTAVSIAAVVRYGRA